MRRSVEPGSVRYFDLGRSEPQGHEQQGRRPCVVVGNPASVHRPRFPMVVVVPLTTANLPELPLYPRLAAGAGGLGAPGTVLLDQVRAVDLHRIVYQLGRLSSEEMAPIASGLRQLLSL